jgi:hypothetical protein
MGRGGVQVVLERYVRINGYFTFEHGLLQGEPFIITSKWGLWHRKGGFITQDTHIIYHIISYYIILYIIILLLYKRKYLKTVVDYY